MPRAEMTHHVTRSHTHEQSSRSLPRQQTPLLCVGHLSQCHTSDWCLGAKTTTITFCPFERQWHCFNDSTIRWWDLGDGMLQDIHTVVFGVPPPFRKHCEYSFDIYQDIKRKTWKTQWSFSSEMLVERLATLDRAACRELRQREDLGMGKDYSSFLRHWLQKSNCCLEKALEATPCGSGTWAVDPVSPINSRAPKGFPVLLSGQLIWK